MGGCCSLMGIASSPLRWSMISPNMSCWRPSESTWEYRFSAMVLAVYSCGIDLIPPCIEEWVVVARANGPPVFPLESFLDGPLSGAAVGANVKVEQSLQIFVIDIAIFFYVACSCIWIIHNRNMSKLKGWTLQSSLLTLWMDENLSQQSNKNC